jgi:hypothetical protein
MKNTIITSISALVFLVIGLFIGKSNKQIEIQTVLKTNFVEKPVDRIIEKIVEKPVVEYVDKYITNVVEKVVQSEIPASYIRAKKLHDSILSSKLVQYDKIPFNFDSVDVNVYLSEELNGIASKDVIQNLIELELRKIGIKIDKNSYYSLNFSFNAMSNDRNTQYVFSNYLQLKKISYIIDDSIAANAVYSSVWEKRSFGTVGANKTSSEIKTSAEDLVKIFCNKVLENR